MLKQSLALLLVGLSSVNRRIGSVLVVVLGVAGVVSVLILIGAISDGFGQTIRGSGRDDRAVVLTRSVEAESLSSISRDVLGKISGAPGIRRVGGHPLVSAEISTVVPLVVASDGSDAFASLRGVGSDGMRVRDEIEIVDGRMFRDGLREVIVGKAAQQRYAGLEVGSLVPMVGGDWRVVGVFSSMGDVNESGLIADVEAIKSASQADTYNSVLVALESPSALVELNKVLEADPALLISAQREDTYLAVLAAPLNRVLDAVAKFIGILMGVGAIFAALNTMNFAVDSRAKEIGTLRCMGFGSGPVTLAILGECLLLALCGAACGIAFAKVFIDGLQISTTGSILGTGPQVIYALQVSQESMMWALTVAIVVGSLGGIFPALRIARTRLPLLVASN